MRSSSFLSYVKDARASVQYGVRPSSSHPLFLKHIAMVPKSIYLLILGLGASMSSRKCISSVPTRIKLSTWLPLTGSIFIVFTHREFVHVPPTRRLDHAPPTNCDVKVNFPKKSEPKNRGNILRVSKLPKRENLRVWKSGHVTDFVH